MKILVLDGYTLFQDDIEWSPLTTFGEVVFHERASRDQLSVLDRDAEVIITNKALVGEPELEHFHRLRLVLVSATGYNCVDVEACRKKGVQVSNVPGYGTFSVAQHTLAMLLNYSNQVALHDASVQKGDWAACPDFCYTLFPIKEWHGKTLGIIGMGNIGKCFADMAASLGMKVIYHHTRDMQLTDRKFVDLDSLLTEADVISLHCPLNDKTNKIINRGSLSKMKRGAVLINTSRGGLIDAVALRDALIGKRIAAALLDVLEKEPPPADHPLIGIPGAMITPHIAWISFEARQRILSIMIEVLAAFNQGQPLHVVY